jgi:protein-arginine kinase activator protein McsA
MKIKLSPTHEGKCMICGKGKIVFSVGDEDTKKIVTICEHCAKEIGDIPTSEVIEKHGQINKEAFSAQGMQIKGLDKLQDELKKRKEKQENKQS